MMSMKSLLFFLYILMFDEYYFFQLRFKEMCICIEFKNFFLIKYMCLKKIFDLILEKIKKVENLLFFFGVGEYYYIIYMFLKKFNKIFFLIVIDKYVDYLDIYLGFIICGLWLKDVVVLNYVVEIFVFLEEKKNIYNNKIKIFLLVEYKKIKFYLLVYISIDKDILIKFLINIIWD